MDNHRAGSGHADPLLIRAVDMLLNPEFGRGRSLLVCSGGLVVSGKIIDMSKADYLDVLNEPIIGPNEHYQDPPVIALQGVTVRSGETRWNLGEGFLRVRLDHVTAWTVVDDENLMQ
jgi:hypothetical protein